MIKRLHLILFILFSTFGFSQDPFLQKPDRELDKLAEKITFEYNKQLALDGDQIPLFELKVEEFLIRAKEIRKMYTGREKLKMLYVNQQRETMEMNNILTRPQLEVYKRIKPDIQPLEVVEIEEKKDTDKADMDGS